MDSVPDGKNDLTRTNIMKRQNTPALLLCQRG